MPPGSNEFALICRGFISSSRLGDFANLIDALKVAIHLSSKAPQVWTQDHAIQLRFPEERKLHEKCEDCVDFMN